MFLGEGLQSLFCEPFGVVFLPKGIRVLAQDMDSFLSEDCERFGSERELVGRLVGDTSISCSVQLQKVFECLVCVCLPRFKVKLRGRPDALSNWIGSTVRSVHLRMLKSRRLRLAE